MANIGATTAFYKVETSLTRANNEVSKSMERLATGKANANAGDRSSYVAMADTFRLDFVGTKAGIKGASVAMGYLETGMRVLDSASGLLSRLQELAVLGANDTNTTADHEAINLEAEAIAQEFNRLMTTASYKGKEAFVEVASSQYVSMGGRDQEMTFGIGKIDYSKIFSATKRTIVEATTGNSDGPNVGKEFNLTHLPSDAVVVKEYGKMAGAALRDKDTGTGMEANKTYVITALPANTEIDYTNGSTDIAEAMFETAGVAVYRGNANTNTTVAQANNMAIGDVFVLGSTAIAKATFNDANFEYKEVLANDNAFIAGDEYEIVSLGTNDADNDGAVTINTANYDDAGAIGRATNLSNSAVLRVGTKFTVDSDATIAELAHLNALTGGMTFRKSSDTLTKDIEAIQALINTARVQAGSQYAAMESAVNYTTDLTAQYELGYNTVNDVNFSMETAHLAKNQILQQAATAMLAQANSGQQGLLQLIS